MRSNCLYPSVTQVLKANGFYNDMDLTPAANSVVGKARGSALHKACHYLALGKEPPWTNEGGHPELDRYLDGYRTFLKQHQWTMTEHEAEWINDKEMLIAHPDQFGVLNGAGLTVIEIKTGALPEWVGLQTAGQLIAGRQSAAAVKRFALCLPGNGKYALTPLTQPRDFAEFRGLLQAVLIRSKYQGKFWIEGDSNVEMP